MHSSTLIGLFCCSESENITRFRVVWKKYVIKQRDNTEGVLNHVINQTLDMWLKHNSL